LLLFLFLHSKHRVKTDKFKDRFWFIIVIKGGTVPMATFDPLDAEVLFAVSNAADDRTHVQSESFAQTEKQLAYIRESLAKNQKLTDSMVCTLPEPPSSSPSIVCW